MKRIGTVLVFKKGVTSEQAKAALATIESLLESEFLEYPKKSDGTTDYAATPDCVPALVTEYESDHGGPVWYVP